MEAQFRIGGVYRNQAGEVVRLTGNVWSTHRSDWEERLPGHQFACAERVEDGWEGRARGYISLMNGRYVADFDRESSAQHLLPGELTLKNGEWIPLGVAQAAPKPASEPTRPRLTWADSKRPDPFDGFIVTSSTTQQDKAGHPLQRMTDPSDQLHGSAFLR